MRPSPRCFVVILIFSKACVGACQPRFYSHSILEDVAQGCNNRCTAAARRKESSPAAAALAADSPLNRSTCRVALDKSGP